MLHAASQPIDDQTTIAEPDFDATVASVPVVPSSPTASGPVGPHRYGARRRPNITAIVAILVVHALAIGALIQVRNHVQRADVAKLTVVNLSPPPPPPPAAETPPPPPSAPQVVAPPPIVQTPAPPVPVQTSPEPVAVPTPAPTMVVAPGPVTSVAAPPAPPSMVQGGDLGTQMVAGKPPRYPVESRRKHEQGTVVLTITLSVDGGVESITVSQSSGSPRLDDAARDAVKGWRWKPTIRGGQPVRVRGVVEIPFILRTQAA
ncbi:TonB family protein [Sphingobium sp. CR2-8]|uniref:energy transducer TonB n=1 Tax=Sphingobium sp. CR2-8 TaxID=1306534 RepID=UPI002DB77CF0|nr:TonB family protein [Sphingobium sp. CR2-8]MEC3910348.1 TonB family protein [Sphingobium sp. CR2-8]